MIRNFQESLELLTALCQGAGRNEATTRLQLIDPMFFECLGWERTNCIPEEPHGEGYADYVFHNERAILVVEAKKEGTYFEVPIEANNRKYKISHFKKDGAVYKAIVQALNYSVAGGIPYTAITNGRQYIVFLGGRSDSIKPLEGDCIVFRSLDDIKDNFVSFWNILSFQGITNRKLTEELKEISKRPLPKKLSSGIPGYPSFRTRNELQADLKPLSGLVIDGLVRSEAEEREFLEECYCLSGALSDYENQSRQILLSRYPDIFSQTIGGTTLVPITDQRDGTRNIGSESQGSKRPIVLLGDVGVGKSIFIKHFINVFSRDLKESTIYFYIDCGREPIDETLFVKYVINRIDEILLSDHKIDSNEASFVRGVYHGEVERFEKSIQKKAGESADQFLSNKTHEKSHHLKNVIRHLIHGRKKAIVCFLDNIDQRSAALQEQAYVMAEGLSKEWGMTVFLALQPETFYLSKSRGVLKSYETKAYTILPPNLETVLEKRLAYVNKITQKGIQLPSGGAVTSEKILQFFKIFEYSIKNNPKLMRLLVNLSGGNIRNSLDYIATFMGSGHVNTRKIFDFDDQNRRENSTSRYIIQDHEFLRAILYGEYQYYYPDASPIPNLFDLSVPEKRGHFLMPVILSYINELSRPDIGQGFISKNIVFDYCMSKGFLELEIRDAIEKLLVRRLLEANTKVFVSEKAELATHLRLTTTGKYCLVEIIPMYVYLEAIVSDTPFLDFDVTKDINVYKLDSISIRIENTKKLLSYLDSQWSWKDGEISFDWNRIKNRAHLNINRLESKLGLPIDPAYRQNPT